MTDEKEIDQILDHMLKPRGRAGREELAGMVKAIKAAGGTYEGVAWEPGDGICPEWRFPFPPRNPGILDDLIKAVWKTGGVIKVFPRGIPHPDQIRVVLQGIGAYGR